MKEKIIDLGHGFTAKTYYVKENGKLYYTVEVLDDNKEQFFDEKELINED